MPDSKVIYIISGPNGAGKTTFATEFLPKEASCKVFINADLIAKGLSPFDPSAVSIKAGKLMLSELDELVDQGRSFAFETTLAGKGYVKRIEQWKRKGYKIHLYFLKLDSVNTAIDRVAYRVSQGGHSIPESTIIRRFKLGQFNFNEVYSKIVDEWFLFDNSGSEPILIESGINE